MTRKLLLVLALLSLPFCAVKAQVPNFGGNGVPNGGGAIAGFVSCAAGVCTFTGADGSTQMVVGTTSNAVDYLQVIGGISGAGPSFLCQSGTDSNVPCNFTAKGTGAINFSNGSGVFATYADPGAAITGKFTFTPGIGTSPANISSLNGVNINGYPANDFSGYVANSWYVPAGIEGSTTATGTPGNGTIELFPAVIKQKMTISTLGARITTLSAGGNCQFAIYATNAATGRPTGSALVSTASVSTAATGNVNSAASVQLSAGIYWFATNCDNATVAFNVISGAFFSGMSKMFGSTISQSDAFAGQTLTGLSVTQTFGTWPSLTSASFGDVTINIIPTILFKVASVP